MSFLLKLGPLSPFFIRLLPFHSLDLPYLSSGFFRRIRVCFFFLFVFPLSMAALYQNSLTTFPLDLNQDYDQCKQLPLQDPQAFSSSSSLSTHTFPHGGSYYRETPLFQRQEADLAVPQDPDRSLTAENESESEFSITVWKKEETNDNPSEKGSVKWMSSKIRLMRKMMNSNLEEEETPTQKKIRRIKNDDQSSGIESSCNAIIRVCSDCNTTKTPLWRSGPRGPKSLCNACGIRQRKARRAMAAAAMAVTEQTNSGMVQKKEKKRCKLGKTSNNGGKSLCFEDIAVKLRKNSAFQRVFPQDEKEAAILLMALSYGLVHG